MKIVQGTMYKGITKQEFGTRHLQPGKGIRIPHVHEKAAKGVCKLLNRLNVYRTTHNRLDIAMKHDKANNDLLVFNFEGDS